MIDELNDVFCNKKPELIAILKIIGSCMGVMQYFNISLKIKFDCYVVLHNYTSLVMHNPIHTIGIFRF